MPPPRPLPQIGGFSLPHSELYRDVRRLLAQMELALTAAEQRSAVMKAAGDVEKAAIALADFDAQMYSRAVQVFAAMAAEAALNTYGLMWFGENDFKEHFERKAPTTKLKALVRAVLARELTKNDEIVRLLDSIAKKRNAHVHLHAEESRFDASGVHRPVTTGCQPIRHPYAGRETAAELNRFLELFSALDSRTANFFVVVVTV